VAASGTPVAAVSVTECVHGATEADRRAQFRGMMRQVGGADYMAMRFGLQERLGDRAFQKVRAPGLGVWQKSLKGVKRFVHRQEVVGLAGGAAYRTRVTFRWYDAAGKVLRQEIRRSGVCRQPGKLANLRVARIGARRMGPSQGVAQYALKVVNRGDAPAPGVTVLLSVDRARVDTATVGALAPGEAKVVFVNGPECGGPVRAEADPADGVVESDESDNALAVPCPLAR
jgi:hypothetical protein